MPKLEEEFNQAETEEEKKQALSKLLFAPRGVSTQGKSLKEVLAAEKSIPMAQPKEPLRNAIESANTYLEDPINTPLMNIDVPTISGANIKKALSGNFNFDTNRVSPSALDLATAVGIPAYQGIRGIQYNKGLRGQLGQIVAEAELTQARRRAGIEPWPAGKEPIDVTPIRETASATTNIPAIRKPELQPLAGGKIHEALNLKQGETLSGRNAPVRITQPTIIKDVSGQKITLPPGEEYTPYLISNTRGDNTKVVLQDGGRHIVQKSEYEKVKQQNIELGEKVSPEEAQVEEVVKGGSPEKAMENYNQYAQSLVDKYAVGENKGFNLNMLVNEVKVVSPEEVKKLNELSVQTDIQRKQGTKFSQYQLPGGENYREVLLKAPSGENQPYNVQTKSGAILRKFPNAKEAREFLFALSKEQQLKTEIAPEYGTQFKSSHWDEPNVLSHARVNDRITPDGKKILFIEEIQSDWARKAREKPQKVVTELPQGWTIKKRSYDAGDEFQYYSADETGHPISSGKTESEAKANTLKYLSSEGTPSHPLLKNWQEFTLKRLVDYAVKNGYDGISWTTGEQQAERYDLSKQVDKVTYDDGANELRAFKDGKEVIYKQNIEHGDIEKYIGKEPAKRLFEKGEKEKIGIGLAHMYSLSGNDLKVGGEWAKNLYDRQIPNILKDLTKGEVGNVELQNLEKREPGKPAPLFPPTQPVLLFTPEIKARIIGQPMAGGIQHKFEKMEEESLTAEQAVKQGMSAEEWVKHPFGEHTFDTLKEQSGYRRFESDLEIKEGILVMNLETGKIFKLKKDDADLLNFKGDLYSLDQKDLEKLVALQENYALEPGPERIFYRSGKPPESGRSYNTREQKNEKGVSVYFFPEARSFAGADPLRKWYFVKGRQIGWGSDDEPVIKAIGKWQKYTPPTKSQLLSEYEAAKSKLSTPTGEQDIDYTKIQPMAGGIQHKFEKMQERLTKVDLAKEELQEGGLIKRQFKGRIERFKSGFMKEELANIPKVYITSGKGISIDEAMQEVNSGNFGVQFQNEKEFIDYLNDWQKREKELISVIEENRAKLVTHKETTLLKQEQKVVDVQRKKFMQEMKLTVEEQARITRKLEKKAFQEGKRVEREYRLKKYWGENITPQERSKLAFTAKTKELYVGGDKVRAILEAHRGASFEELKGFINNYIGPLPPKGRGGLVPPELNFGLWNDKHPLSLARETFERNIEDIAGKDVEAVKEFNVYPIIRNDTAKVNFTNQVRTEVRTLVDNWKIHKNSLDDKLVMRYGEGNIELEDLKNQTKNWQNIVEASRYFRSLYDKLLDMANATREKFGYTPISKRADYFRHFQEHTFVLNNFGIILSHGGNLPTEISGITHLFRPGKPFTPVELKRLGMKTTESAIGGVDNWLDATANQIFHTDSVQRARILKKYIDTWGVEGLADLPNFNANLQEYGNLLAGKKALIDRVAEQYFGREFYRVMNWVKKQTSANMIAGNISSALTNFIPFTQSISTTNPRYSLQGLMEGLITPLEKDFTKIEGVSSGFLTRRYPQGAIHLSLLQKTGDVAGWLFKTVDMFTARSVLGAKYHEILGKNPGIDPEKAMFQADSITGKILADRSWGQLPNLMKSATLGPLTMFQTEINNMYSNIKKDIPRQFQGNIFKISGSILAFTILCKLYNDVNEKVTGRRPQIDPVYTVMTLLGMSDRGRDQSLRKRSWTAVKDLGENLPFTGVLLGGGRLPISAGLPDISAIWQGKSTWGEELQKPAYYLAPPFGGGQLKKTIEGLSAYNRGYEPGPGGRLKYAIKQSPQNLMRSALFGKYATPEAQASFDKADFPEVKKFAGATKKHNENINKQAAELYLRLKKVPAKEANEEMAGIYKTNQELFDAVKNLKKSESLSGKEKAIKSLPIEGGARAKYIFNEANKLKTPDEKNALIQDLHKKGLITDTIIKQLKILKEKAVK